MLSRSRIRALYQSMAERLEEGGAGSGNYGHAGRPGVGVGGSAPRGDITTLQDLTTEAGRYGSAKEFAAAQMAVYHGSRSDFDTFRVDAGDSVVPDREIGAHFAVDKEISDTFAAVKKDNWTQQIIIPQGYVKKLYLAVRNPYKLPQRKYSNGVYDSDQRAFQTDIARHVFPIRKDLFVDYWSKNNNMPKEEAGQIWDDIKAGKFISKGAGSLRPSRGYKKDDLFAGIAANHGMLLFDKAQRKEFIDTYRHELRRKGYDAITYRNTSPMEMMKAKNPRCVVVFDSWRIKTRKQLYTLWAKTHPAASRAESIKRLYHTFQDRPLYSAWI